MSQTALLTKLTKLEKFFLISGIIGLTADIITITSLFRISERMQGDPSQKSGSWLGLWILSFFCILYTSIVINFAARRALVRRHKSKSTGQSFKSAEITLKKEKAVNTGTLILSSAFAIPMFFAYFVFVFVALSHIEPEFLDKFFTMKGKTPDHVGVLLDLSVEGFIFSTCVSVILALVVSTLGDHLYDAIVTDD